jgi:hypothetical protein
VQDAGLQGLGVSPVIRLLAVRSVEATLQHTGLYEAVAEGIGNRGRPGRCAACADLNVDIRDMPLDRADAQD